MPVGHDTGRHLPAGLEIPGQDMLDPSSHSRRPPFFRKEDANFPQPITEGPGWPGQLGTLIGAEPQPYFAVAPPASLDKLGIPCIQGLKGYPACGRGRLQYSLPYETQRKAYE